MGGGNKSTRHKLRLQAKSAWEDLKRAQEHLIGMYAISDGRHPIVDEHLPTIVSAHELVMAAVEKVMEDI